MSAELKQEKKIINLLKKLEKDWPKDYDLIIKNKELRLYNKGLFVKSFPKIHS